MPLMHIAMQIVYVQQYTKSLGLEHSYKMLVVVCRVGEHQHQLTDRDGSLCENFFAHTFFVVHYFCTTQLLSAHAGNAHATILFTSNSIFPISVRLCEIVTPSLCFMIA